MRIHRPLVRPLLVAGCVVVAAAGCTSSPPRPDVAGEVLRATDAAELISFESEGGPTDVAPGDASHLAMAEAVRLALAGDPDVQVALWKLRAAEADARQARLLPNPVLSVMVRLREGGGSPIVTADLTADVLSVLQIEGRTRAADRRLRAAAADALAAALDLVAEVEQAYSTAQSLDAQAKVLAERGQILARLLSVAQQRLNAGEGTRLDVTSLQAERVALEAEVADRQLERTAGRLTLARLIGRPSDPAGWELDEWAPPPSAAGDERAWVDVGLANRPEVRARQWELLALGDDTALAAWDPFKGADAGAEAEYDQGWTLGPAITTPLPLFDFGQASRAKARAEQVQARHGLTKARRRVVEEVRSAHAAYVAAAAAVERLRSELVPLQEQRRAQAEAIYRAGESDLTAVLVAEQALQEAREKLLGSQEKASAAWSKLCRAAGGRGVAAHGGLATTRASVNP